MNALLATSLTALALLVIAWVGYPLALIALARRTQARPVTAAAAPIANVASAEPLVTVIVATRDAPETIARRVDNLLAGAYPRARLRVVVAIDHTSSHAVEHYAAALGDRATVVRGDAPGRKAATLNAGVRAATGELLVFADSQQEFAPDAIPRLVHYLADARYGAVSGGYASATSETGRSVLDLFWRLEVLLRRHESAIHSCIGVTGAIYAVRRALWAPLPANLICDDLYVPFQVVLQGSRVGYCEAARAYDPRRFTRRQEFERKVRNITGILQFCAWRPVVLVPGRNPVWIQFVCHKLLRLATPYLAIVVLLGVLALATMLPLRLLVGLAAAAVTLALVGAAARPRLARRVASQLGWAVSLQAAPMVASMNAVRGRWDVWKRH